MKLRTLKCPNCDAQLTLNNDDREYAFCEYCGGKIILHDYRSLHRVVDEARIKEDETRRIVRLKELELEERELALEEREAGLRRNRKTVVLVIALICALVGVWALETMGGLDGEITATFFWGVSVVLFLKGLSRNK